MAERTFESERGARIQEMYVKYRTLEDLIRPNINSEGVVPSDLTAKYEEYKSAVRYLRALSIDVKNSFAGLGKRVYEDETGFVFENLEVYPGQFETVRLNKELLENGTRHVQGYWWSHSREQRTPGVVLPSARVIYQMMHRLYTARDNSEMTEVTAGVRGIMNHDWQSPWNHLGTRINYKQDSADATLEELGPDLQVVLRPLRIPEYARFNDYWSYLILAKEQTECDLGKRETLLKRDIDLLESLFGPNALEAGSVFQYLSTCKGESLREVRLWTPMLAIRARSRALVLGVDSDDGFFVGIVDYINGNRPARGVEVVRERHCMPGVVRK